MTETRIVCDKCGATTTALDAGFDPAVLGMSHDCGGKWVHKPIPEMQPVTKAHVREMMKSQAANPTLIRFVDTGEVEVVPEPYLSDISWSCRSREYDTLISKNDVMDGNLGDYDDDDDDEENKEEMFKLFAVLINDTDF